MSTLIMCVCGWPGPGLESIRPAPNCTSAVGTTVILRLSFVSCKMDCKMVQTLLKTVRLLKQLNTELPHTPPPGCVHESEHKVHVETCKHQKGDTTLMFPVDGQVTHVTTGLSLGNTPRG